MRQRLIACVSLLLVLILVILPVEALYEPLQTEESCEVHVTGRVGWLVQKEGRTQIYLKTCQVRTGNDSFEEEKLLVYMKEPSEYTVGTDLSLSGTIYPIKQPTNPGQFDSRLYYAGKGIRYTVFADRVWVSGVHPAPVRNALLYVRERVGNVYDQVMRDGNNELLKAMILGEKEDLDTDTKELYQKSGISHLLAISGLHISLVGLGGYHFLRRLTGYFSLAGIPSILFVCAYGWMTGASVSAVRAVIMCGLTILADMIGRTYDMLTGIGAAAMILVLMEPLHVRQSSFLLSFGAALGIALIQPLWLLYREKPGKILQSLSVSLSVLCTTFPLLLRFFCEYSLYSILLNLLAIPFMSMLMVCGIFCGLSGLLWMPAAKICAIPCRMILAVYEWMGEMSLKLPGAVLHAGSPSDWKLILYYIVLAVGLCILYREHRRKKYWHRRTPFKPDKKRLMLCAAMVILTAGGLCTRVHRGLEIVMLDVGQGESVYFRNPSGKTFLFDGGSTSEKNVGLYRILPFLKSEGISGLDYIFVSHADQDHISGLMELIEESRKPGGIRIRHAVLPEITEKDSAYRGLENMLTDSGVSILYMSPGDRLADADFSLTCLWPEEGSMSEDKNDLSLTLMLDYNDFQMLFTGDIGEDTERSLLASGRIQDVEVLKVAHHGSRYSSSEAFLETVRPEVALISCSEDNLYGHPAEETLERLKEIGSHVYVTKDCGAIRVWTDGDMVKVSGYAAP